MILQVPKKSVLFLKNTPNGAVFACTKTSLGGVMEERIEANAGLFLGTHWAPRWSADLIYPYLGMISNCHTPFDMQLPAGKLTQGL